MTIVCCIAAVSATAQYTAEVLPTPNGSGRALAAGGNQIVGGAFGAGGGPCLWDGVGNQFVNLTPAGYDFAEVNGVGGGKQVGYGFANNDTRAIMWSGSAGSVVDLHPQGFLGSIAYGTDGMSQVGAAANVVNASHAVLWKGTAMSAIDLHPAGYEWSEAYGTDNGVQVGTAENLPVMWASSAASMVLLPRYKGGLGGASAIAGGQIVGTSNAGGTATALLWDATTHALTVLGDGRAADTNGSVQVGFAGQFGAERAKAWFSQPGTDHDLHKYLPPEFVWSRALGIDETGRIVGYGEVQGVGQRPIVWTPVPEPNGLTAVALGIGALAMRRRRKR